MLRALVEPKRASSQAEMSCFRRDMDPWLGSPGRAHAGSLGAFPSACAAPKSLGFTTGALLRAGNLQTWTPGWAPGPGWTKKSLFSSRNELFLEETWTPCWAPGPIWTQKVPSSSRNELFFEETWTPVWAPGAVLTQKRLFSSRNELFLEETWTPGWAPDLFGPKRACSQAEMSCF